jgi:hypothetical protein
MAVSGSISISSNLTQTPVSLPGATPVRTAFTSTWTVASGTAADQADRKYAKPLTLAAGTPTVLDLTALTDLEGNPVNFARVKSIIGVNRSQVPGQVVLFGYATTTANAHVGIVSNPGQMVIRPSTATNPGVFAFVAPDADGFVVGPTSKLIQLDPGAHTIELDLEICGSSV